MVTSPVKESLPLEPLNRLCMPALTVIVQDSNIRASSEWIMSQKGEDDGSVNWTIEGM